MNIETDREYIQTEDYHKAKICKLDQTFQTFHVQTEGIMSIFELNFHLKKEHKFQNQCYAFMPSKNQIQNFLIHSFSIQ